jgi:DMSO/TMAO reductase YedYZ heme-binding membrane subunit
VARRLGRFEGPRLLGWLTLACALLAALAFVVEGGPGEEGIRAIVRSTARTSIVLFLAAFTATSLRRLWRAPATAWLLRNRRWVGLSMAASHAGHLAALVALAVVSAEARADMGATTLLGGGLGYAFLAAMAATSNDRAVARLGARRWRALHRTGGWVLWAIFALSYVPRALASSGYVPLAALVLGGAALRLGGGRLRESLDARRASNTMHEGGKGARR